MRIFVQGIIRTKIDPGFYNQQALNCTYLEFGAWNLDLGI
jgi:hypothetical protein